MLENETKGMLFNIYYKKRRFSISRIASIFGEERQSVYLLIKAYREKKSLGT